MTARTSGRFFSRGHSKMHKDTHKMNIIQLYTKNIHEKRKKTDKKPKKGLQFLSGSDRLSPLNTRYRAVAVH